MIVTIIGTGHMARGLASRALATGSEVVFVGTDLAKAQDLTDELTGLGEVEASEQVRGRLLFLAVPFTQAPHAVRQHAAELTAEEPVVVDVTNPIDLGAFRPIDVSPFNSGAELIADVLPDGVPLVKAFNTTFAGTLYTGELAGHPLDVFLAGDDERAKDTVSEFVRRGKMRPVDTGPLVHARELEAAGYLHMLAQGALGSAFVSALKILP
jgi:predicted dinucleotide-binding enzyme